MIDLSASILTRIVSRSTPDVQLVLVIVGTPEPRIFALTASANLLIASVES